MVSLPSVENDGFEDDRFQDDSFVDDSGCIVDALRLAKMLIYQIILESGQVFERQDLTASEQSAAIVNQLVVDGLEHVHVDFRKFEFL